MASNSSTLPVTCGEMKGVLDTSRFGPGGRSRCILFEGQWLTLTQFEDISGKSASHNWKRSVKYNNRPLIYWIDDGKLKLCSKACCCHLCQGATSKSLPLKLSNNKPKAEIKTDIKVDSKKLNTTDDIDPHQQQVAPKLPALMKAQQKDSDSDSGISVSSCTKALMVETNLDDMDLSENSKSIAAIHNGDLTSTCKGDENDLDYTAMIQEALLALAKTTEENGCSQMHILLYILHTYSPSEDIMVVYNKVKASLRFLTRMGVTKKFSTNGNETDDSENEDRLESNKVKSDSPAVLDKKESKNNPLPLQNHKKKISSAKQIQALSKMRPDNSVKSKLETSKSKCSKTDQENKKPIIQSKPKLLSPQLAVICGSKQLCRQEVVKMLWRYVKKNDLQDPNHKSTIICDDKLKAVTKKKIVPQTDLLGFLKFHLKDIE